MIRHGYFLTQDTYSATTNRDTWLSENDQRKRYKNYCLQKEFRCIMLLNKPLSYFFSTSSIISAPLCWRPIMISLLVRPSICPYVFMSFCTSVNPRSLVRNISPFSIALYGPYFTQRVPLSKEGVVTTNQFSRSNVKVLEKYI